MDKNYAFVVDGDVFHTIVLNNSLTIGQRWMDGLDSNPIFIRSNLYPQVCANTVWDGNYFYLVNNPQNPIPFQEDTLNGSVKYAGIVNNIVFGSITFSTEDFSIETIEMLDAAMQSEPIIVEIPPNTEVDIGWTWNGNIFNPPGQE